MKRRPLAERVVRPSPRSAGSKNVLPFYRTVGNAKRVAKTYDVWKGRVFVDVDSKGNLIGVEII